MPKNGMKVSYELLIIYIKKYILFLLMSWAGFEPASANTQGLKSCPLDLSGTMTGPETKKEKNASTRDRTEDLAVNSRTL